jgi:hypothetical protein
VAKRIKAVNQKICISEIQTNSAKISSLIGEPSVDEKLLKIVLGDILFSTVQLTHSLKLDAEDLLRQKTIQVMQEIDQ